MHIINCISPAAEFNLYLLWENCLKSFSNVFSRLIASNCNSRKSRKSCSMTLECLRDKIPYNIASWPSCGLKKLLNLYIKRVPQVSSPHCIRSMHSLKNFNQTTFTNIAASKNTNYTHHLYKFKFKLLSEKKVALI